MQSILRIFGYNVVSQEELQLQQAFVQHMSEHGLSYGTEEEFNFRMGLYAKKDAEINEINARETSFTVGHNHMSTWTDAEYKKLLGYAGMHLEEEPHNIVELEEPNELTVDWREKGAVVGIKDQGQCGSCWAFSATAAAEGAHFLKTGRLLIQAEQQLVDCSWLNMGCHGGLQSRAFFYLDHHKQEMESQYPYIAKYSGKCKYDSSLTDETKMKTWTNVPKHKVSQLKAAIQKQPVAVTIEADKTVFQHYTQGVLDSDDCGTSLDHAVTAVGYGTDEATGKDYYLVRNSWGASWGDGGYIRIAAVKDGKGVCGIQQVSLYPTAKDD